MALVPGRAMACGGMTGAKRVLEPFGAFHGWQTAGLNASKKPLMWPGRRRKAMDMASVYGLGSWACGGMLHASLGFGSFTIWLSAGINENKLQYM